MEQRSDGNTRQRDFRGCRPPRLYKPTGRRTINMMQGESKGIRLGSPNNREALDDRKVLELDTRKCRIPKTTEAKDEELQNQTMFLLQSCGTKWVVGSDVCTRRWWNQKSAEPHRGKFHQPSSSPKNERARERVEPTGWERAAGSPLIGTQLRVQALHNPCNWSPPPPNTHTLLPVGEEKEDPLSLPIYLPRSLWEEGK